jgi:hypothetical protein
MTERLYNTGIHLAGGGDGSDGQSKSSTHRSFNMRQTAGIMNNIRRAEINAGMPRRKVAPVTVYLLEELFKTFFADYASKNYVLEKITIRDNKYGRI